jgi:stage V sporulation protein K
LRIIMLKSLLEKNQTVSIIVGATAASLLSAWLLSLASHGSGGFFANLTSSAMLPQIFGAIAVILAGASLTYVMFRLSRVTANVTNTPSGPAIAPEQLRLLRIVEAPPAAQEGRTAQQAIDDLDAMVGLMPVKSEVNTLIARLKVESRRRAGGMNVAAVSQHMVFTGPPGVGKTEVARAIGDIVRGLGVLKKGHLIETGRNDFVGQYIGHTAQKTLDLCNRSLDGILFIDEAYELVVENMPNDFGKEAIGALTACRNSSTPTRASAAGFPRLSAFRPIRRPSSARSSPAWRAARASPFRRAMSRRSPPGSRPAS